MAKPIKKRRSLVVVDGSNLYFKIKTAVPQKMDLLHFQYAKFAKSFVNSGETVNIRYYIGVVRVDKRMKNQRKATLLRTQQQRLFAELRRQKIEVVHGYLMEIDNHFVEKGVDVRMAIDIVTGAYQKTYDTVYVVSSDTDLIPAIQYALSMKRQVVYVGFGHRPSVAMSSAASRSWLAQPQDILAAKAKELKIKRFDD